MLGIGNGIDMSSLVPPYSAYSVHVENSTEFIEYGTGHDVIGSGDFSIAAWVKIADIVDVPHEYILSEYEDIDNHWVFFVQGNGALGFFTTVSGSGSGYYSNVGLDADDNDTWIHVAVSYDRDDAIKFYINGSHVANHTSDVVNTNDLDVSGNLRTGWNGGSSSDWIVNDVAVWSSALIPAQITKIYNNGEPLDHIGTQGIGASNLIHWWRMGDGPGDVGTTIKDQVGSIDGTLTSGTSIIKDAPNNP